MSAGLVIAVLVLANGGRPWLPASIGLAANVLLLAGDIGTDVLGRGLVAASVGVGYVLLLARNALLALSLLSPREWTDPSVAPGVLEMWRWVGLIAGAEACAFGIGGLVATSGATTSIAFLVVAAVEIPALCTAQWVVLREHVKGCGCQRGSASTCSLRPTGIAVGGRSPLASRWGSHGRWFRGRQPLRQGAAGEVNEVFAIAILAPGLILGTIAWGVVGVLRQRGREEFTQATAAAMYAQVMVVAGVLATLVGASVLVKLLLSLIDPAYSYFVPQEGTAGGVGLPSVHDQQAQDLILAAMLAGIGLLTAVGHALLARFVAGLRGGAPVWIVRGTPIVLTVLTGLAGFLSVIFAGYFALVHFIVSSQNSAFGDPAGSAAVFLPAWIALVTVLVRQLHRMPARPPAAMAST